MGAWTISINGSGILWYVTNYKIYIPRVPITHHDSLRWHAVDGIDVFSLNQMEGILPIYSHIQNHQDTIYNLLNQFTSYQRTGKYSKYNTILTHSSPNKLASPRWIFEVICWNENLWISNWNSLKIVPNTPFSLKSAIVQVIFDIRRKTNTWTSDYTEHWRLRLYTPQGPNWN